MRRGLAALDITPRADAGIGKTARTQRLQGANVVDPPLRLRVGRVRTADVGPLVPVQTEPAQVRKRRVGRAGLVLGMIKVLHAQQQRAATATYTQPRDHEGTGIAEVQRASGAGREPSAESARLEVLRHADMLRRHPPRGKPKR